MTENENRAQNIHIGHGRLRFESKWPCPLKMIMYGLRVAFFHKCQNSWCAAPCWYHHQPCQDHRMGRHAHVPVLNCWQWQLGCSNQVPTVGCLRLCPRRYLQHPPVLFSTSAVRCFLKLYSRRPSHAADDKPSNLLGDCAVRSILETSMISNGIVETASITDHGVLCQTNLFQDGMTCQGQMTLISGCYNQKFITLFRLDGGDVCLVIRIQKENTKRKTISPTVY